jgi:alpha,alpha-trehalase
MWFLLALVAATFASSVKGIYVNDSSGVIAPCDSPLYCQGPILQAIELARPFTDSKTYVDLPTVRPLEEVLAAFAKLPSPLTNGTELQTFLATYFGQPGGEIAPLSENQLVTNATFLDNIDDEIVHSFLSQVLSIIVSPLVSDSNR